MSCSVYHCNRLIQDCSEGSVKTVNFFFVKGIYFLATFMQITKLLVSVEANFTEFLFL